MHQRTRGKLISRKLANKKVRLEWPKNTGYEGYIKGSNRTHTEHIDGLGIVAEHQRLAVAYTPPEALLAEGEIPAGIVSRDVGIEQSELIDGSYRGRRLDRIVIHRSNCLPNGQRIGWCRRSVLVFSPNIQRENPFRTVG